MNLFFVDVEATTRSPATGVMCEIGLVHAQTDQTRHCVLWYTDPHPENPTRRVLRPDDQPSHLYRHQALDDLYHWVMLLAAKYRPSRPLMVSDNPAYDFMWLETTLDRHGIDNPFGHSARRIGDYAAGLQSDFSKSSSWKRLRVTPHDHNPVNDAMGNLEAFRRLQNGERP